MCVCVCERERERAGWGGYTTQQRSNNKLYIIVVRVIGVDHEFDIVDVGDDLVAEPVEERFVSPGDFIREALLEVICSIRLPQTKRPTLADLFVDDRYLE